MRRTLLVLLAMLAYWATPAYAQPIEPGSFLLRCMTSASAPTHTAGVVNICSSTTSGEIRVTGPVTQSGPWTVEATITNAPEVQVGNLGPSDSPTYATTPCYIVSAASTNSTNCKNAFGNLYGYELFNTTTTVYWLRLYNTASAPTCSSATGFIRSIPIPPAASAGQVNGVILPPMMPIHYATGISFCLTGGSSSTDNTNAAVGIFGVLKYK